MANDAIYVSPPQVSNINYSRHENGVTFDDSGMNLTMTVSSTIVRWYYLGFGSSISAQAGRFKRHSVCSCYAVRLGKTTCHLWLYRRKAHLCGEVKIEVFEGINGMNNKRS